jgi:hypothetical protein
MRKEQGKIEKGREKEGYNKNEGCCVICCDVQDAIPLPISIYFIKEN